VTDDAREHAAEEHGAEESTAPAVEAPSGEVDALAAAEKERDEYLDALQRLKAEFDNYRKRVAREEAVLVARASERLVKELVPVLDDLERALVAAADHGARSVAGEAGDSATDRLRQAYADEAKLEEGVGLVHRALAAALAREGLVEIETNGKFDPHTQEALLAQPSDSEEGTVLQVLQKGYKLGDRVLRPARVVISSGAGD
jgi:molecular chaperone GrpE